MERLGKSKEYQYQFSRTHISPSLCLTPVSLSKHTPCSPKHLLQAVCLRQISTCKVAEANGSVPYGLTYCKHSSYMEVYFSLFLFIFLFLMKYIDVSLLQTSPLSSLTLPIHQTNRERKEKWNRFLFVCCLSPVPEAGLFEGRPVSDLSGEKLMSKIVLSAPKGYWETADNCIQGLSKTLRSNSSCFTGCKHRSSHLSDTSRAGRATRYRP